MDGPFDAISRGDPNALSFAAPCLPGFGRSTRQPAWPKVLKNHGNNARAIAFLDDSKTAD
jgi:hypothetical protein